MESVCYDAIAKDFSDVSLLVFVDAVVIFDVMLLHCCKIGIFLIVGGGSLFIN